MIPSKLQDLRFKNVILKRVTVSKWCDGSWKSELAKVMSILLKVKFWKVLEFYTVQIIFHEEKEVHARPLLKYLML